MMYTQSDIKEIIRNYHRNVELLKEYEPEPMASVGISIISAEPMGGGITDNVAKEALKRVGAQTYYTELATDIKYLEQRFYRITDSTDAAVLKYRLDGYTLTDISGFLNMGKSTVHDRINKIARTINRTD